MKAVLPEKLEILCVFRTVFMLRFPFLQTLDGMSGMKDNDSNSKYIVGDGR